MASPGGDSKKRKAESHVTADDSTAASGSSPGPSSMLSPILRDELKQAVRHGGLDSSPGVWVIGNRYYYDNNLVLFNQHVEMLNEEFRQFFVAHPQIQDHYWYVAEYLRRINKLKDMYQSPFVGKILTCGLSDMCALGYEVNSRYPRPVMRFTNLNIVKISVGSTFNLMVDIDGNVHSFGGQDEGGMGRDGEEYDGDLRVRGFIPSKNSRCPVENEDECIIMVEAGYAKSLALSQHGNVYTFGCFRDYEDKKLREKPLDVNVPDRNDKLYPFGAHYTPCHLYEMPPGMVTDLACGCWMNAVIVDGNLVTWGVGTKGELGRPVPDAILDKERGRYYDDVIDKHFLKPTIVPSLAGKVAISVACGQGHLMVVVRERGCLESTVYASGLNGNGQLGLGDFEDRKVLTPLEYSKTEKMMISVVKAGMYHTLALSLDGKSLYACGKAEFGQGGYTKGTPGAHTKFNRLQLVLFPTGDLEIEEIACGEEHNLAIAKPPGGVREVYTWGSTVPLDDACCLGHNEEDRNEYRPRKLVLLAKKDNVLGPLEGGVMRHVGGGAQHSTFLYTPEPKASSVTQPNRKILRKIGPQ